MNVSIIDDTLGKVFCILILSMVITLGVISCSKQEESTYITSLDLVGKKVVIYQYQIHNTNNIIPISDTIFFVSNTKYILNSDPLNQYGYSLEFTSIKNKYLLSLKNTLWGNIFTDIYDLNLTLGQIPGFIFYDQLSKERKVYLWIRIAN